MNSSTSEDNVVISCSYERNLKIWRRSNFEFLKNYNLTSITSNDYTR